MEKSAEPVSDEPLRAQKEELVKAYTVHRKEFVGFARYRGASAEAAEDLVQTAFLNAWKNLDTYEPGTNMRAFLFEIIKNLCVNRFRRAARHDRTVEVLGDVPSFIENFGFRPFPSPDSRVTELSDEVRSAMNDLSSDHSAAIRLVDVDEMLYREVAAELSVPIGTVMSRLHRARRILRNKLAAVAQENGIIKAA